MDFGSLLSVAQKNAKINNNSTQKSNYYSTKFEPPKKISKEKKLSDGIKRFLQQKEHDDREKSDKKKQEYAELMAKRSDRDKNKIRKMLKVTKSANRSVLDDASSKTDTAVTLEGPDQPDEDDYGYTSHEASALYKNLMDKYKSLPEDKKFSKSSMNGSKTSDLMSTKDRVRAAIMREKEEEKLGRAKSVHSSIKPRESQSSADDKHRSRKNLYDPRAERDAEERKKKQLEDEKRQKMKKRPPPPVMDFQKLLALAAEKQHQPIQIEVQQKPKEPERLLTSKEKREMEMKKAELERRKNGLPSKPQTDSRKSNVPITNGRIPKLNGSTSAPAKPTATDTRKPSQAYSKESTMSSKAPSNHPSNSSKQISSRPNASQPDRKRPIDLKSKPQLPDRNAPKNVATKSKPIDPKSVKPREFPPRDVIKSREFPPRPMMKGREFPPRDMKGREFPPRDMKGREFPPRDVQRGQVMRSRPAAGFKRRVIESDEESEYDSEMDDFIDDDDQVNDYSTEIRKIFGYDKSRYVDDDDDVDNMESSFAQQQREEFISKKIGLQEDLEDMRMEEEENKRKAKRRRR